MDNYANNGSLEQHNQSPTSDAETASIHFQDELLEMRTPTEGKRAPDRSDKPLSPIIFSSGEMQTLHDDLSKFVNGFIDSGLFDKIDQLDRSVWFHGFVTTAGLRNAASNPMFTEQQQNAARVVHANAKYLSERHWDWTGSSGSVSKDDLRTLLSDVQWVATELARREEIASALKRNWNAIVNRDGVKDPDFHLSKNKLGAFLENPPASLSARDKELLQAAKADFGNIAGGDSRNQPNFPFSGLIGDIFITDSSVHQYLHQPKESKRDALDAAGKLWDDIPVKSTLRRAPTLLEIILGR